MERSSPQVANVFPLGDHETCQTRASCPESVASFTRVNGIKYEKESGRQIIFWVILVIKEKKRRNIIVSACSYDKYIDIQLIILI